ncbi:MAG: prephenate dehydratase [Clostridiales bacterium]|nr:prephenate dehydratase [Clostridiales bacterium]MCF8022764.1 prephenate dehydratase [Clostridiales bacterium]
MENRIAFLGPQGTFSEEAVTCNLQWNKKYTVPCNTLEEVCRGITEAWWENGLLPVENSNEGPVGQTMDLLIRYKDLKICREVLLPVRHCLLVPPGVAMKDIRKIFSHPQALAQCRSYLENNLPGATLVETASTAHAAKEVSKSNRPWAALASEAAARRYRLQILEDDPGNGSENVTRFFLLGKEEIKYIKNCKTTVIFTISDRPGALNAVLNEFALQDINLTRIESRPSKKKLGEYIFTVDFCGHIHDTRVKIVMDNIKNKCSTFRVAGSYYSEQTSICNYSIEKTLQDLRRDIDVVDKKLLELLDHRMKLTDRAACYKEKHGIKDIIREKEIIENAAQESREKGIDPYVASEIFKIILNYSVTRQHEIISHRCMY